MIQTRPFLLELTFFTDKLVMAKTGTFRGIPAYNDRSTVVELKIKSRTQVVELKTKQKHFTLAPLLECLASQLPPGDRSPSSVQSHQHL